MKENLDEAKAMIVDIVAPELEEDA